MASSNLMLAFLAVLAFVTLTSGSLQRKNVASLKSREVIALQTNLRGLQNYWPRRYQKKAGPPEIINIKDEEDFKKRVIDADKPVVLEFAARWCGPCKLLGPRLEMIVTEEKGRVVLAKVDIDENVEIAMRYNVKSLPAVYGMKGGKVFTTSIGLQDDYQIKSFVRGL